MNEHSSRRLDGDQADAAIDRAVREIMSREPRPGFRQRVLARLDDDPRTAWSWGRLGLAAGVAALALILALWTRREPAVVPPMTAPQQLAATEKPAESREATRPPQPQPPAPAIASSERPRIVTGAPRPAPDRRVTAASVNPIEEAAEPGAAPARPGVDPIAIAPLRVQPLETPELIVRPMAVGPLVIVPILPPR